MDYHPLNYLSFNTEGSNVSSNIKRITLVASLRRWPLSSVTGGRIRSVLTGLFHRHTQLGKFKRKTALQMSHSLNRTLCRFPQEARLSLTYDNGTKNTNHLETNHVLGTKSFFCAPFHSWEKGTVENTIGLVRRYLPKKTDLAKVSLKEFKAIERWLNNRPRKCLGFKTPAEVFRRSVGLTP